MYGRTNYSLIGLMLSIYLIGSAPRASGADILGVFTSHSPSELIINLSVMKALAERGHNITVVSSVSPTIKHKNIKNLVIPLTEEEEKMLANAMTDMANTKSNMFTTMLKAFSTLKLMIDKQFDVVNDERFKLLYANHYDLVFMGYLVNTYQLGIAAKFKCPSIVTWSAQPMEMIDDLIGNPRETSYVPNINLGVKIGTKLSFQQRLLNMFTRYFMLTINYLLDMRMQKFYDRLFSNEGDNFPSYSDMKKNISLVFCNSHAHSEGPIRPNVPNLIEIGGIQAKEKPEPLPKDIGEFLTNAKNGVILFSLGTNLKGNNINPNIVQIIFQTLSSLKQNVIWKWENLENLPGKAANILYKKWLPQDDILAHPNIKLFITHAGKGGMAEAQYHGVPMLALPVFGDQPSNADKIVENGYGLQLDLNTLQRQAFSEAINEILTNNSYTQNIKKFSKLYRDRPMSAAESVVYWTEYVLRHHGAAHMQSPLVHMSWLAAANLDIYVLLAFSVYIIYLVIKIIAKLLYRWTFNRTPQVGQKQKKIKKN